MVFSVTPIINSNQLVIRPYDGKQYYWVLKVRSGNISGNCYGEYAGCLLKMLTAQLTGRIQLC